MPTEKMKDAVLTVLKTLKTRLNPTRAYKPEKYYMRGPGPACAAKAQISHSTDSR